MHCYLHFQEMENLSILNESLQRSETMTHNMLGILNSFESRLGKLEETIIPIYQETGNLQRRHESILKWLADYTVEWHTRCRPTTYAYRNILNIIIIVIVTLSSCIIFVLILHYFIFETALISYLPQFSKCLWHLCR